MFILDFDFLGALIFLWFIFKGLRGSQEAKKKRAQRQRNARPPRPTTPRKAPETIFEQLNPVRPFSPPKRTTPEPSLSKPVKNPPTMLIPEEPRKPGHVKENVGSINEIEGKLKFIEVEEIGAGNISSSFSLDKKAIVNGVIWAEILGPPRAKKKYQAVFIDKL